MTQYLLPEFSGTLVTQSLDRLNKYAPKDGYYLAFSGGKDSIVCHDLLEKSCIDFDAHYAVTTIDPPELTKFIREFYPEVEWHRPIYKGEVTNFYKLVQIKGLPNRHVRWCCHYLKETGGYGRTVVTGVRREESRARASRPMYISLGPHKKVLNPIIDWKTTDIWEYIHTNTLPYPVLYDQGDDRVGCILCPLKCIRKRHMDLSRYPSHVRALKRNLSIYLENHPNSGLWRWGQTVDEIFLYWIAETPSVDESGQCTLGDML